MAKPTPRPMVNPAQVTTDPNKIFQQVQRIKDQFSMNKGRADQIIADAMNSLAQGNLDIIAGLLQRNTQLETELKNTPKVVPKKLTEHEKTDATGKAGGK